MKFIKGNWSPNFSRGPPKIERGSHHIYCMFINNIKIPFPIWMYDKLTHLLAVAGSLFLHHQLCYSLGVMFEAHKEQDDEKKAKQHHQHPPQHQVQVAHVYTFTSVKQVISHFSLNETFFQSKIPFIYFIPFQEQKVWTLINVTVTISPSYLYQETQTSNYLLTTSYLHFQILHIQNHCLVY